MTESNETPNTVEQGDESKHRRIKSFVMRAGRMTEGQQKGLEQGTPLFVLPLADAPVDYDQVFGRSAPRSLEIGFGMGHSLLEWPQPRRNRISSVWKSIARVSARCSMAC